MDGGSGGTPSRNLLILIIVLSVAVALTLRVTASAGLDWMEQTVRDQLLVLSLAVALLALFKETRR
ncbi:MAG TPA: hypothetical protein VF069_12435 [Streptosporangiaceae bacterium]